MEYPTSKNQFLDVMLCYVQHGCRDLDLTGVAHVCKVNIHEPAKKRHLG